MRGRDAAVCILRKKAPPVVEMVHSLARVRPMLQQGEVGPFNQLPKINVENHFSMFSIPHDEAPVVEVHLD